MPAKDPAPARKILSRAELLEVRQRLATRGRKLVFTNGCFDLLHRGHVEYLREARALGDALAVGLNSDASARALKGPGRPLMSQEDRAVLLSELQSISFICIFDEPSVESLVAQLRPDVLVKGGDYALEQIVGRALVEAGGGQVRSLSLWPGLSTSQLLRKIQSLPA